MTSNIKTLDPVQGLLDYINDIKPYHTKVIEILTEYVYDEQTAVTINEDFQLQIDLIYPNAEDASQTISVIGGFGGTTAFGGFGSWPVIPPNPTLTGPFDLTTPGYDLLNQQVLLPGNRINQYSVGQQIIVDLFATDTVLETRTVGIQTTYTIIGAMFNSIGQIGGILNTQHTALTVSGLVDPSTLPALGVNEVYSATVNLVAFPITAAVGYSNASPIFYTDVPPGASPSPTPGSLPQSPDENPAALIFSNSFLLVGDVSSAFTQGFKFEVTGGSVPGVFTTKYAHFDGGSNTTYVRVVETIDLSIPFVVGTINEEFFGFDEGAADLSQVPIGLTNTDIVENLVFSWSDPAVQDVIDGYQFFIKDATTGTNLVVLNGNALILSPTDTIQIIGSPSNNGVYTVLSVTQNGEFTDVVVNESISTTEMGGWVEQYTGP